MSEVSDKYYSRQELTEIAERENLPNQNLEDFIDYFEKEVKEILEENKVYPGSFEENTIGPVALENAIQFIIKFNEEIKKGHGRIWSRLYAANGEEHHHAFGETYQAVKQNNPALALEELKIHCKSVGGNDLYTKRFIFLMEHDPASMDPDGCAAEYAEAFAEQIEAGKSELFAHKYADNIDEGALSAFSYASAYEDSINAGKSKEYAEHYANKYSDYVGDNYSSIKGFKEDKEFQFHHDYIIGYMKAWEYATIHQLKNAQQFFKCYVQQYTNVYYSDSGRSKESEEVLDKIVLEKALIKFNKAH